MNTILNFQEEPFELTEEPNCGGRCHCLKCGAEFGTVDLEAEPFEFGLEAESEVYIPSSTRRRFEEAAARREWEQAYLNLNGLNMYEMLRALDGLSYERRNALLQQRENYRGMVHMPRIEYAAEVVQTGRLPSIAPGDLKATGQVQTAREFLGGRRPQPPYPADGKKYTNNPNEVVTRRTTPTPREVVNMLRMAWPELSENGARTLTAQFMGETGGGKYCFNWNLGNVKEPTGKLPHMYLRNVWEVVTPRAAEAQVNRAGGLARIASDLEVKKNGWSRPAGMAVVVFSPPHPACRFRAYTNLRDGAQRWLGHHQRIARQNSDYLASVNAGDTKAVAHALKMARYYTAGEAHYARLMATKKAEIDRILGST